jgi:hypothetical protein
VGRAKRVMKCKGSSMHANGAEDLGDQVIPVIVGEPVGVRELVGVDGDTVEMGQPVTAAGPRARPPGLESKRADLLRCLAHEPVVSRLVALVR